MKSANLRPNGQEKIKKIAGGWPAIRLNPGKSNRIKVNQGGSGRAMPGAPGANRRADRPRSLGGWRWVKASASVVGHTLRLVLRTQPPPITTVIDQLLLFIRGKKCAQEVLPCKPSIMDGAGFWPWRKG